ncbi:MAG TPA: VIT1/CCC1 transporter family protein [Thermotogota bacterium]|nr:VIT1/CCC1 transporter family protein [Thermotogota bacterium]HRW93824.1 VIT1/CCC1 transporter family protein [Thermotogota bacterium]
MTATAQTRKRLKKLQKGELTDYRKYTRLASLIRDKHNAQVLEKIAADEKRHYQTLKKHSGVEVKESRVAVFFFVWMARILGLTFSLKLMERNETSLEDYRALQKEIPEIGAIITDEEKHEMELIDMINEERLSYMGSVVLGLNDALVELTGALAGFTLSIQNSRTIALLGLITGISASLSMAASEYLSTKAENNPGVSAKKASLYTGVAYVFTVLLLISPYLLISNFLLALFVTIGIGLAIIALFNFYLSVATDQVFRKRFFEMAAISVGVAMVSFLIGFLVKKFLGLEL